MKNFDEYIHFVVGAKIAGCEIEWDELVDGEFDNLWTYSYKPVWNWAKHRYRIKLPEGWEYVIENGEIAFREPKEGEWFLTSDYRPLQRLSLLGEKRPIIKRTNQ